MMAIRDFYEGGMILFDIDAAYRYEYWLAGMLKRRLTSWWEKAWWLRDFMYEEFDRGKFKCECFHALPGDPLVPLPDVPLPDVPRILLLKGRHLHRLQLNAVKKARRFWRYRGIPG